MTIRAVCTCGKTCVAQDSLAGKRVKCPKCGTPIDLPLASASHDPLDLVDLTALETAARPLQIERPAPTPKRTEEASVTAEKRHPSKPAPRSAMSGKATPELQRGLAMLVGGPLMAVVGVVATVISYQSSASRGMYTVFHGAILGGLIMFGYGCMSLIRVRNYRTGRVSESGEAGIDRFTRNLGFVPVLFVAVILAVLGILATLLFG